MSPLGVFRAPLTFGEREDAIRINLLLEPIKRGTAPRFSTGGWVSGIRPALLDGKPGSE